jgi:hypothetical protein
LGSSSRNHDGRNDEAAEDDAPGDAVSSAIRLLLLGGRRGVKRLAGLAGDADVAEETHDMPYFQMEEVQDDVGDELATGEADGGGDTRKDTFE